MITEYEEAVAKSILVDEQELRATLDNLIHLYIKKGEPCQSIIFTLEQRKQASVQRCDMLKRMYGV